MIELVRARAWWQYKLAPVVTVFLATALVERVPLLSTWVELVLVVMALAVCASYVSIINDLADRDDDAVAGKVVRQFAHRRGAILSLLAAIVAAGAAFAWSWRTEPLLVAAYASSWVAFSLYSLPPFRLKARGVAGVVCDASGAHLFPSLTAILAVSRTPDHVWTIAVAAWAFAFGIRGIVWHQLADIESDVKAGVHTFAVRAPAAARMVAFAVFPVEVTALAVVLWRLGDPGGVISLACYVLLLALRMPGLVLVVVQPRPGCVSVLQEYYDLFLPVGLLVSAAFREWRVVGLLIAFAVVFPSGFYRLRFDVAKLAGLFASAWRLAGRALRAQGRS